MKLSTSSFSLLATLLATFALANAQSDDCGQRCWDAASSPSAGSIDCDPSDFDCLCHNGNFLIFASRCTMNCDDAARAFVSNRCAPFTSTPAAPTPVATA
ncbi:hypothetical protein QCA50_019273 [Cerrena zonata]|uniref:Extracellular membrane protein CFEM domain-containing protein n=1 Tax=Cerrena zonata TaxID=2478898 RepID=A0AAW0FBI6_9APHY